MIEINLFFFSGFSLSSMKSWSTQYSLSLQNIVHFNKFIMYSSHHSLRDTIYLRYSVHSTFQIYCTAKFGQYILRTIQIYSTQCFYYILVLVYSVKVHSGFTVHSSQYILDFQYKYILDLQYKYILDLQYTVISTPQIYCTQFPVNSRSNVHSSCSTFQIYCTQLQVHSRFTVHSSQYILDLQCIVYKENH